MAESSKASELWFSAAELARFGKNSVARLPGTSVGCKERATREAWPTRKVKGKGGPGGVKTVYQPPTAVLKAIGIYLSSPAGFEDSVQYDTLKVYNETVVKLNARPKGWLEDIVNHFVSLPEKEQEKIAVYSQDLYEKVTRNEQRKQVKVTISGIVELPLPDLDDDNDTDTTEITKEKI